MVLKSLLTMLLLDNIHYGYGWRTIGSLTGRLRLESPANRPPITLISGPNGAGKTTFLRTIAGLLTLLDGRIQWNEAPIEELQACGKISYLGDALNFGGELRSIAILESLQGRSPRNLQLLNLFSLPAQTAWKRLSTGQKQKLRLCLILRQMEQAELIILDEPFTGLDLESRSLAMELLREKLIGSTKRLLVCLHQESFPANWLQNRLHFSDKTFVLESIPSFPTGTREGQGLSCG